MRFSRRMAGSTPLSAAIHGRLPCCVRPAFAPAGGHHCRRFCAGRWRCMIDPRKPWFSSDKAYFYAAPQRVLRYGNGKRIMQGSIPSDPCKTPEQETRHARQKSARRYLPHARS
ncbi:hypothetical protein AGR4C_Cc150103 [Agrobacterium tumefaciens str. Kerr 14]|uniref:Uncharacterized protein n=1 Tax=Agrobacterium tumefaciens str. Kerr 14 TaxID=1183424 RepID=A0A1S7P218_AGRTU|nr:hypothetical protein AGR4C_Cc150103 [Agrobacterium tumefaciens str. Kerr 14]